MNDYQREIDNMLDAVVIVCDKYSAIWSGHPIFSDAFQNGITALKPAIRAAIARQRTKPTGIAEQKRRERAKLEGQVSLMAERIAAYAVTSINPVLKRDAHLPPSTISRAKDDALVGMVSRIAALANVHIAALGPFGITAADVTALSAQGMAYTTLIGAPARLRDEAKEGTIALAELLSTARQHLEIMDAYMVLWRQSQPEFFDMYFMARRIRKPARRKRVLELELKNAEGSAIEGARVHLPAERLMRRTSARGICRVQHLPEGEHTAEVIAVGYMPQQLHFHIRHGVTRKLEVVLQKA